MIIKYPAPICLFVYKRVNSVKSCISSLLSNRICAQSDLYIFSDAASNARDRDKVEEVRQYLDTIEGFRSIQIYHAQSNKGLAKAIIEGVTKVINVYGSAIVLEDDLEFSDNFLSFMNSALEFYESKRNVFSISGYSFKVSPSTQYDVYFTKRASSWGWATWKDRWSIIDWDVKDYKHFEADSLQQQRFNQMGSDLSGMLKKQMRGEINSWAIRWTYHQFKQDLFSVFPFVSKVSNEGFGVGATHTSKRNRSRFFTLLDKSGRTNFKFPVAPYLEPNVLKQFTGRYSLRTRAFYKLRTMLNI